MHSMLHARGLLIIFCVIIISYSIQKLAIELVCWPACLFEILAIMEMIGISQILCTLGSQAIVDLLKGEWSRHWTL